MAARSRKEVARHALRKKSDSGSTIIQTAVPDDMRARTGSANNALITAAQLISMGLAGILADSMGARNLRTRRGSSLWERLFSSPPLTI